MPVGAKGAGGVWRGWWGLGHALGSSLCSTLEATGCRRALGGGVGLEPLDGVGRGVGGGAGGGGSGRAAQGRTGQQAEQGRQRQGRARQGSTGNTHRTRNVRYTGKGLELATEADAKGLGLRKKKMKKMRERTWKLATAALAGQTTSGCRPQGVGGYV